MSSDEPSFLIYYVLPGYTPVSKKLGQNSPKQKFYGQKTLTYLPPPDTLSLMFPIAIWRTEIIDIILSWLDKTIFSWSVITFWAEAESIFHKLYWKNSW